LGGGVSTSSIPSAYFVKQLHVKDRDSEEAETRMIPMLREYTVFNIDQCDGLPDTIRSGKPIRVRNPDTRDALADNFPYATSANIREGQGEAYFAPGGDFISLPAFEAFKGADHFYKVAFHELTHNAEPRIMPREPRFPRETQPDQPGNAA
jgi:antirestriction protein ArdC